MTPTIHLVTGSTGAGKTTYALRLADEVEALRFSLDDWTTTLFFPDEDATVTYEGFMERIDRCDTMIWQIATDAARRGLSSVLDLGFVQRSRRRKFVDLAAAAGLPVKLHFVDVPAGERWARVETRNAGKGETHRMDVTREMFDFVEGLWEPPGEAEMAALDGVRV